MAQSETVIHVLPYGNFWKIKLAGERNYHSVYRTRADAIEAATHMAKSKRPSRLIVHREDGTVESEQDYNATEE